MAKVIFEMDAKAERVVRAYMAVHEAQKKTETGARRLGQTTKETGRQSREATRGMGSDLGGLALRYVSLSAIATTGIMAIRKAWQDVEQAAREALEAQVPAGQAWSRFLLNMPAGWDAQGMEQWAERMQATTGMTKARLADLMQGVSAKGALAQRPTLAAAEVAATIERLAGEGYLSPEALSGFFAVANLAGAKTKEDVMNTVGWSLALQRRAKVIEPTAMLATMPRAVTAMQQAGFAPEEGGRLWATITQVVEDYEGRRSAMAVAEFAKTIRTKAILPERRGRWGMIPETMTDVADVLDLMGERYQAAAPTVRGQMLRRVGGGARLQQFLMGWWQGPEGRAQAEWQATGGLPAPLAPEAGRFFTDWLGRAKAGREAPLVEAQAFATGAVDLARRANVPAAQYALVTKTLEEMDRAAGVNWIDRTGRALTRAVDYHIFGVEPQDIAMREAGGRLRRGWTPGAESSWAALIKALQDNTEVVRETLAGVPARPITESD